MKIIFSILLAIGIIIAVVFSLLVLLSSKGDAMQSGGSGVRTTFRGKASFDDLMSRIMLGLAIGFLGIILLIDITNNVVVQHASK